MSTRVKFAIAVGAALTATSFFVVPCDSCRDSALEPELVTIASRTFQYRPAGEFTRNGLVVDAPIVTSKRKTSLTIMRHQVTSAAYEECVREGACPTLQQSNAPYGDRPVVNVNWNDANAYASWLSRRTGRTYRLPTDEEWIFAAGSRFADDAVNADESADPSKRWLARYEKESNRENVDKEVRPVGAFGFNEYGMSDIAGNVWEWTDTCFRRVALDASPARASMQNCGVRVVAGSHRSYMTDFIRDPRSGGCAVGVPPVNLGFRLVRA
jgi:formylglycine-generating enzyme required for sulfatase activity